MELSGLQPGDTVNLMLRWGNQVRHKCPVCRMFVPKAPHITCRCGTVYRVVAEHDYEVVSVRGT